MIAHLSDGHYVVLHERGAAGVVVGDPATGIVDLVAWSGEPLILGGCCCSTRLHPSPPDRAKAPAAERPRPGKEGGKLRGPAPPLLRPPARGPRRLTDPVTLQVSGLNRGSSGSEQCRNWLVQNGIDRVEQNSSGTFAALRSFLATEATDELLLSGNALDE